MNLDRIVTVALICFTFPWAMGGCARRPAISGSLNEQLFAAAEKGDAAAAQRLLKKGADVNAKHSDGWTPLILAAGRGDVAMVKLLLDKGARTGAKNPGDPTALKQALLIASVPVVELLLQNGADKKSLNEAMFFTITEQPMFMNATTGEKGIQVHVDKDPHAATIALLLEKGAEINARDEDGGTALIAAAGYGLLGIVEMLLQEGADIEARNNYGSTPLLVAACDCAEATMPDTLDVVKVLLQKGANINARDRRGDTALMVASGGGVIKTEIVKLLIEKGADLKIKNNRGETALMVAKKSNVPDVVRLLKAATAQSH
jgi:ankyrin repeat protein